MLLVQFHVIRKSISVKACPGLPSTPPLWTEEGGRGDGVGGGSGGIEQRFTDEFTIGGVLEGGISRCPPIGNHEDGFTSHGIDVIRGCRE